MEELVTPEKLSFSGNPKFINNIQGSHKNEDFVGCVREKLADILTPDRRHRSQLISILQEVQDKLGYLSQEAMLEIAQFLEIPGSLVYSVVTFYNQFRFIPLGKHAVKVCMGTACHLAGGRLVLEAVERELDIEVGGITPDHDFSLDRVACVGCCALAPVVVINDAVYPKMTPWKAEELFVSIKPGSQERMNRL